jgi:pimeloyl-ACP methyl ester carboxylesterase
MTETIRSPRSRIVFKSIIAEQLIMDIETEHSLQSEAYCLGSIPEPARAPDAITATPTAPFTFEGAPTDTAWSKRVRQGKRLLSSLFPQYDVYYDGAPGEPRADDGRAAILVAPCTGAHAALITFGGNAGYLVLPPAVQALAGTHVIAIRDPKRCFSLCGITGIGDTYETCRDNLRGLLSELGVTSVHCFGVSAGGYSALRFGLDLGAKAVLAMSPPTTLDLASEPGATLTRYPYLTALYRIRPEIGVDLVPLYEATLPRPRVLMFYSPHHERDEWLANRMRGIPGIRFKETPDKAGHRVMQLLSEDNTLERYVKRLMRMRPLTKEGKKAVLF